MPDALQKCSNCEKRKVGERHRGIGEEGKVLHSHQRAEGCRSEIIVVVSSNKGCKPTGFTQVNY